MYTAPFIIIFGSFSRMLHSWINEASCYVTMAGWWDFWIFILYI